ncbi:MAG: hypothetical protein NVSMB12_20490 [Acidimicrobiales bacterium]
MRRRPWLSLASLLGTLIVSLLGTLLGTLTLSLLAARPASAAPADPGGPGYWMVASDGGVFSYGRAGFAGSTGAISLAQPIVALLPTPTGRGYWMAATDGGVFAFGDAPFLGSTRASAPIVAIIGTPTGGGYWLVAADGGVFTFGDATFFGRPPASAIHAPIVSAAVSPSGQGYWLVAADGSVYPEGDAGVLGDASRLHLARPIVAMASTASGRGYWLVADDGGVFTYGDAAFLGSTGAIHLNRPIVALAPTADNRGYWMFASDGGVFAYGDAPFLGSTGGIRLNRPVVRAAAVPARHGTGVAAFYYPWYARQDTDGAWRHWDQGGHVPPDDIGSDYYPMRGAYSSSDGPTVESQMGDLAASGIDEAISSWWGRGSYEDSVLPGVIAAASHHGVAVGVHLEPYVGRTAASVMTDVSYLRSLGVTDIWIYEATDMPSAALAAVNDANPDIRMMAETGDITFVRSGGFAQWAFAAHFRGIYQYDPVRYEARDFPAFCASARPYGLVCAPVAAPGFYSVRAGPVPYSRSRDLGRTYDRRWMGVLGSRPDVVAITSYNEWHEGSQIEPAVPKCLSATFCYLNYEGAYGSGGSDAPYAYLNRTQYWSALFHARAP